jgi:hypothetical protein
MQFPPIKRNPVHSNGRQVSEPRRDEVKEPGIRGSELTLTETPRMLVLCPTFGRAKTLLDNLLYFWKQQSFPQEDRVLVIYDDGGVLKEHLSEDVIVVSSVDRHCHLPDKYHHMITIATTFFPSWNCFALMDDDDIYLRDYLTAHAKALEGKAWSHPSQVYSTYPNPFTPVLEGADGRFHGSLAMTRKLFDHIDGWKQNSRADFDQDIIARCKPYPKGDPCHFTSPQYVFRWADSNGHHCQALMRTPSDKTWYEETAKHRDTSGQKRSVVLEPKPDGSALKILEALDAQF